MSSPYREFEFTTTAAGNGESGVGLTNAFIEIIRKFENVNSLCDLGCGNGYMAGRLAELGYNVTGVDGSESGIAIARANFLQSNFIHATIDSTLQDRTGLEPFDLVISSDVVEHLYRPADLIEAAASLVKPEGWFLISTPYHGYLKNLVLAVTGKMDSHFGVHEVGGHIKFFSVKTLADLLTKHGFRDLQFSYYGRVMWLWKGMICLARKAS